MSQLGGYEEASGGMPAMESAMELLREMLTSKKLNDPGIMIEFVATIDALNDTQFDNISKTVQNGEPPIGGTGKARECTERLGGEFTCCTPDVSPELDMILSPIPCNRDPLQLDPGCTKFQKILQPLRTMKHSCAPRLHTLKVRSPLMDPLRGNPLSYRYFPANSGLGEEMARMLVPGRV